MEEDKYKAALERAKSAIKECGGNVGRIKMIESIFPELTGDMDEQSRKWILEYLYDGLRKADEQFEGQFKAAIAYLEKLKDFDKQLEEAYKTADEVQYKRGYDAAMREITCTEREADAKTIRELQERINELTHLPMTKKSDKDWSEEDERLMCRTITALSALEGFTTFHQEVAAWLKDVKQRLS